MVKKEQLKDISYGEENIEAKTDWNRSEPSPNAIYKNTSYTHNRASTNIFPLILNCFVPSLYSHKSSYNNAVTQCHVDGSKKELGLPVIKWRIVRRTSPGFKHRGFSCLWLMESKFAGK